MKRYTYIKNNRNNLIPIFLMRGPRNAHIIYENPTAIENHRFSFESWLEQDLANNFVFGLLRSSFFACVVSSMKYLGICFPLLFVFMSGVCVGEI